MARTAALVCVAMAALAAIWTRGVAAPAGVLGGGFLIGLSYWAIKGTVDALVALQTDEEHAKRGRKRAGFHLVKFFTRHGMLALAAYVMMVRLHLSPVGMLAGVSALAVAVGIEVLRDLRWRRFP